MIKNPVLRGFCPDPSVLRVGEDFYIATSTFEWWPGVRIFHSRDLSNWEQIASPLRRESQIDLRGDGASCGVWSPGLSYSNGKFWLTYADVRTRKQMYRNTHNYLVWTDDIHSGEWSDPVYLNSTGSDPTLFHDNDGKKYIVNTRNGFRGIVLQEYDHESGGLTGEIKNIFPGTLAGKMTGPHLYHRRGYYYLMMSEGGTGYEHSVSMARARNIWGPYELDPGNPLITSRGDNQGDIQHVGHADLFDTIEGEYFMAYVCARPIEGKHSVLGRETSLHKAMWTGDDWLRLDAGATAPKAEIADPLNIPLCGIAARSLHDDFDSDTLDHRYSFLRTDPGGDASLSERAGYLRLHGRESFMSSNRVTLMATRQQDFDCIAETKLECDTTAIEHMAGLMYFYHSHNFYMLAKTFDDILGKPVLRLIKNDWDVVRFLSDAIVVPDDAPLYLRVEAHGLVSVFSYSLDGTDWTAVKPECDGAILTDEYGQGFTGSSFCLYCHDVSGGRLAADFDYFEYKAL